MKKIRLPYLSALHLSGKDAGPFLHNQLSADVLDLSQGQSTFACYCEPRGRVLALILAGRVGDTYYLILSAPLAAAIAARLKIYVMRDQVDIVVMNDAFVSGLHAGVPLPASVVATLAVPDSDAQLLIMPTAAVSKVNPSLQDAWKFSDLQRGISWLDTASSGQFLPQMLGLDRLGAVNYHKGCYPGQEIVARTHYLGKVKRHPRFLSNQSNAAVKVMDKINIRSAETTYEAIVVDSATRADGSTFLFVVTRMDPDLPVEGIQLSGNSG